MGNTRLVLLEGHRDRATRQEISYVGGERKIAQFQLKGENQDSALWC